MSAWLATAVALLALGVQTAAGQQTASDTFSHRTHRLLFPTCTTCHAGATGADAPLWPSPEACAACHDGSVQRRVNWRPPGAPRRSNVRFTHALVPIMMDPTTGEVPGCTGCHEETGAPWMAVQAAVPERCLSCHGVRASHLAAPDTACASCHLPLVEAKELTRSDIAGFPAPPSHADPSFLRTHGQAAAAGGAGVAASCATCHARDFCLTCHVDAPERRAIQALGPDPRALAISVRLTPPASHGDPLFLRRHGGQARARSAACRTCHTRESCYACHAPTTGVAAALLPAGPGRGRGALVVRHPPTSHGEDFAERHRQAAVAASATCAACHVRADCYACHRPDAGRGPAYHPVGFLARHPAAAYGRDASCAECHNVGNFCQSCHAAAGLTTTGSLSAGYHDAKRFFIVGHGQAARQNLESCVSCHVERDCLACHSALGGRRFNPHGPGFDPARLRRKNPEVCTACHGTAIPQ